MVNKWGKQAPLSMVSNAREIISVVNENDGQTAGVSRNAQRCYANQLIADRN